jgi:hypothetical protein
MINRGELIDVLRTHGQRRGIRDMRIHCLCGWRSTTPNGLGEHLGHQADQVMDYLRKAAQRGVGKQQ